MNHKALLGTAVAAALLFGAQAASACAISAWSSVTGVVAADAGDPTQAFKRYSGSCSLRVANASTPRFVTDTTPNNEAAYRVRFYYFTGDISGATASIFQARNTGGTNIISVTHDGSQLSITANGATATNVTVQDNKYYAIELNWSAGAGTGTFTGTVKGAGSATAVGTINFTTLSNSGDSITEARMGIITGAPTVTAPVFFDEFDSRRTTSPGRLCRGDANNDNNINVFDIGALVPEIQQPANAAVLTVGQPDFTEDGAVNVFDIGALVPVIQANTACSAL
jgi:hypothetical protein